MRYRTFIHRHGVFAGFLFALIAVPSVMLGLLMAAIITPVALPFLICRWHYVTQDEIDHHNQCLQPFLVAKTVGAKH